MSAAATVSTSRRTRWSAWLRPRISPNDPPWRTSSRVVPLEFQRPSQRLRLFQRARASSTATAAASDSVPSHSQQRSSTSDPAKHSQDAQRLSSEHQRPAGESSHPFGLHPLRELHPSAVLIETINPNRLAGPDDVRDLQRIRERDAVKRAIDPDQSLEPSNGVRHSREDAAPPRRSLAHDRRTPGTAIRIAQPHPGESDVGLARDGSRDRRQHRVEVSVARRWQG